MSVAEKKMTKEKSYGAADIEVLEGLEPVRKRPGMFIAGTDTPAGLHQLVFEILDNSVDEAMNGHASRIDITLHADGQSVTISDNGRGIPVEKHPKFKKPALELILTTLHAGGKFSDKNYQTAGGLHGVGSSVVNALSSELVATVTRDGKEHQQSFARGKAKGPLKTTKENARGTGTAIFFRPDSTIFPKIDFSKEIICDTLQTKAYLNPGLRLVFLDEKSGEKREYFYTDGLIAYLKQILEERKAKIVGEGPFLIERDTEVGVTIALAWTESTSEEFRSYANGIHTGDGGSHEIGAKNGIVKALRNYIAVHDIQMKGLKLGAEDIREGLVCLVAVKMPGKNYQAQFQGQTKSKLNNPEIAPLVEAAARSLEQLLNEKPSSATAIVNRIMLAAKARQASREAVEGVRRKIGISHRLNLPGKLADCSSTRPEDSELFIVEGDSAGGSTKQGRDRGHQAVLPLRGKVLNTIASAGKKIADNKELSNVISALGAGSDEGFRFDKLRYHKVIILTDADADGMHIATLLMAFFFKHLRPLIAKGCLYLGKPPLYGVFPKGVRAQEKAEKAAGKKEDSSSKISGTGKKRRGAADQSSAYWAYSDEELREVIAKHKLISPRIVRYKGLGEMNPSTLWDTTLDPNTRTLLRITVADEKAVTDHLQSLMGTDSSTRYQLIQDNAALLEVDV